MEFELICKDPDVFVMKVPYAHLGLGGTNCYLVRDGDDALLIDPGASSPLIEQRIEHALREVGVKPKSVRFLCTHLHFDHAANLKTMVHPGSRVLMGEQAYHTNPYSFYELRGALLRSVLREEGVAPARRRGIAAIMQEARVCDLDGCEYVLLDDGQEVRVGEHLLRVIATPGHDRGHICLYSAEIGLLFSGDHVLKKTTPGLSLRFEGDDSLDDYFASLSKVEGLECQQVLPGHGVPFGELAELCADLRQRHVKRLGQIYETVAQRPGANGDVIMKIMPWKKRGPIKNWQRLNPYLVISMSAQTFSYLEHLVNLGELVREEDADGRHYRVA